MHTHHPARWVPCSARSLDSRWACAPARRRRHHRSPKRPGVPDGVRGGDVPVRLPGDPVHHDLSGPLGGGEAGARSAPASSRWASAAIVIGLLDGPAGRRARSPRSAASRGSLATAGRRHHPGGDDAVITDLQARRAAARARRRCCRVRAASGPHEPGGHRHERGDRRAHRGHRARPASSSARWSSRASCSTSCSASPTRRTRCAATADGAASRCCPRSSATRHAGRGRRGDVPRGRRGRRQADGLRARHTAPPSSPTTTTSTAWRSCRASGS